MQKIQIIGNVGRDAEMRYTPQGKAVTQFSVAVTEGEETMWFKINAWDNKAEICNNYVKKGMKVYVDGRLKLNVWEKDGEKKTDLQINAFDVVFLSKVEKQEQVEAENDF